MSNIVRYLSLALALSSTAAMAMDGDWSYRIKLTKNTGGLDIAFTTFVGPAVVVGVQNRSSKAVFCIASFVSYPHTPTPDEQRGAPVPPGKGVTLAYPARKLGIFSTAFVDVKCSEKFPA